MSWGNTASGNALQVKEQASKFAASVGATDRSFNQSVDVSAAHQAQARAAEKAIAELVDSYPEGAVFSISVSASIGSDGKTSGYVNLGYTVSVPTAVAAA